MSPSGGVARRPAERIPDALIESAIVVDGLATWIGPVLEWCDKGLAPVHRTGEATLYDGSAGIAMASWIVGVARDRNDLRELALRAARHAVANVEQVSAPGLYDGLAGIGLAGLLVGRGADSTELTRSAIVILDELRGHLPDRFDIIGGVAGIALGFVRAAELTGDDRWVEAASSAAERLVSLADRRPWGWAWANEAGDPGLCGLAHGAAGAAWALAEVARVCRDPHRFDRAIAGARQFERSWFDPRTNRWPDLRPGSLEGSARKRPRPALWCHGSVGIGVSRLAIDACQPHPALKAEVAAALQSSCAAATDQLESGSLEHGLTVCHGLVGTVDFLLDAHLHLGESVHLRTARWLIEEALALLGDDVESWPGGVLGRPGPGLMNGLAGTMLVLARLADPGSVPSMVRLDIGRAPGGR